MLRAKNDKEETVYSFEPIGKSQKFFCPECKERLTFVDARFKIKHFRHKVESHCDPEPETIQHLEMKQFMLKNLGWDKSCLEVGMGFARPDLFKDGIAVEVQHSPISYDKFIERTSNYRKNNVHVIWIFHTKLLKEMVSETLKKAHEIYFGRIYVYSDLDVSPKVYPVHLQPSGKWVEEYHTFGEDFGGYYKYHKKKKIFNQGTKIRYFQLIKKMNTWKKNEECIANDFTIAAFEEDIVWWK